MTTLKGQLAQVYSQLIVVFLCTSFIYSHCALAGESISLNTEPLFKHAEFLSSDLMAGRKPNTSGHQAAQEYIVQHFSSLQLNSFNVDYRHIFEFKGKRGVNLIARVDGKSKADRFIVISAHYDHLGSKGKKIFNGANDNASGVAVLLELARIFSQKKPEHSIVFLATDYEESGLYGAMAFVETPPIAIEHIVLNINIDMVGEGGRKNSLYAIVPKKQHELRGVLQPLFKQYTSQDLLFKLGKERKISKMSVTQSIDWRMASDHGAFNRESIPYVFFGAIEEQHYHTAKDTFENLDMTFFALAAEAIVNAVIEIDKKV